MSVMSEEVPMEQTQAGQSDSPQNAQVFASGFTESLVQWADATKFGTGMTDEAYEALCELAADELSVAAYEALMERPVR
jgi:hypothetical protein